jgi:D-alanyl-D-alanine carboxypeptidase/D-alanyl-D-alanine-endopeptidase (penicillin-binding protein 4)
MSLKMKNLLLCFVLSCWVVFAKEQPTPLHDAIEKLICETAPDVHLGIEVVSLETGERLYQKNAQHHFVPASCLKMFTGAAALYQLGVDYCFETRMFTDGNVDNGILHGNLYLRGSGDPELGFQDLEELCLCLKALEIKTIEGNLYVDNTLFDGISQGPGWMWDEGAHKWNSPMDALTINHSCIDVCVRPSEQAGQNALAQLHPQIDDIVLKNTAVTTDGEGHLKVARPWIRRENVIEVTGQIPLQATPVYFMIPLEHPHLYTGHVFRATLFKAGIALQGNLEERAVPEGALLLGAHASRPLRLIVEEMMKSSDNLYADCLFKKLGESRFGAPGTWHNGALAVREFLATVVGLDVEKMVIVDGSGLSRYNLISAHQFVTFLSWMHAQPGYTAGRSFFAFSSAHEPRDRTGGGGDCIEFNTIPSPASSIAGAFTREENAKNDRPAVYRSAFVAALPESGVDGTLFERMGTLELKGKVRAKTGSMTGISSLSGYLTIKEGETLGFAILQNGFIGKADEYKTRIEDGICRLLVDSGSVCNPVHQIR